MNLFNGIKYGFGTINFIWIFLGTIFTYLFFIYFYKKSTLEIIPIHQITDFKEKSLFGIKTYYIILNDGKYRDLIAMKSEMEFDEFKNRISEIQNKN